MCYLVVVVGAAVWVGVAWGLWPALALALLTIGLPVAMHHRRLVGRFRVRRAYEHAYAARPSLSCVRAWQTDRLFAGAAADVVEGLRTDATLFAVWAPDGYTLWQRGGEGYERLAELPLDTVNIVDGDPDRLSDDRESMILWDGSTRRRRQVAYVRMAGARVPFHIVG